MQQRFSPLSPLQLRPYHICAWYAILREDVIVWSLLAHWLLPASDLVLDSLTSPTLWIRAHHSLDVPTHNPAQEQMLRHEPWAQGAHHLSLRIVTDTAR